MNFFKNNVFVSAGVNYNAAVHNFGDNAQTGGSRDTYHGEVDKSEGKIVFGNNTKIDKFRTNGKLIFTVNYSTRCLKVSMHFQF